MPFDPEFVAPNESAAGEFDEAAWPDQLSVLADQLRDDAVHLASAYPASNGTANDDAQVASVERKKSNPWKRALVIGGTLASVLLVVVTLPHLGNKGSTRSSDEIVAPREVDVKREVSSAVTASVDKLKFERSENPTASNVEFTPSFLLLDATGPELEGLLDLLEHEETGEETLSI